MFLGQAGTFLCFWARSYSATQSLTSSLTLVALKWRNSKWLFVPLLARNASFHSSAEIGNEIQNFSFHFAIFCMHHSTLHISLDCQTICAPFHTSLLNFPTLSLWRCDRLLCCNANTVSLSPKLSTSCTAPKFLLPIQKRIKSTPKTTLK